MNDVVKHLLKEATGHTDDWEHVDGPETGVGVEFWLRHPSGLVAYVCDDQDDITVSIQKEET